MKLTREGKKVKKKFKDFRIFKLKKSTPECLKSRRMIDKQRQKSVREELKNS